MTDLEALEIVTILSTIGLLGFILFIAVNYMVIGEGLKTIEACKIHMWLYKDDVGWLNKPYDPTRLINSKLTCRICGHTPSKQTNNEGDEF